MNHFQKGMHIQKGQSYCNLSFCNQKWSEMGSLHLFGASWTNHPNHPQDVALVGLTTSPTVDLFSKMCA